MRVKVLRYRMERSFIPAFLFEADEKGVRYNDASVLEQSWDALKKMGSSPNRVGALSPFPLLCKEG